MDKSAKSVVPGPRRVRGHEWRRGGSGGQEREVAAQFGVCMVDD